MTSRLKALLLVFGASALLALLADLLWPSKAPPEVIQATQRDVRKAPTTVTTLTPARRVMTAEGDDLFAAQPPEKTPKATSRPITASKPQSTGSQNRGAAQIRAIDNKVESSSRPVAPAPMTPDVATPTSPSPPAALSYAAFGQYVNADKKYLLLTKDGKTVVAQMGDVLDGTWRLTAISNSLATWQHLSTAQTLNIPVPSLP